MTGLEKLTGRILSDAEDFARSLLSSAEAEAAEIKKSAEAKIKNIKSEYAARAEKEEQVLLERAAASASSLARDIVLAAKASLLDEIYGEAKKAAGNSRRVRLRRVRGPHRPAAGKNREHRDRIRENISPIRR